MNEFLRILVRQLATDLRSLPAAARDRLGYESSVARCRNISELRTLARKRIPRTVFDYDDRFIAPRYGFRGAEDYYSLCEPRQFMQEIRIPTDLPTCCEFGGENLDVLYVTSAVLKRPPEHFKGQSNPGGLFAVHIDGVKGLTLPPFEG